MLRAILDAVEFNRREASWMVNYVQTRWKLTAKVAEEAYRFWLQGLTQLPQ